MRINQSVLYYLPWSNLEVPYEESGLCLTVALLDHVVSPLLPVVDCLRLQRLSGGHAVTETAECPVPEIMLDQVPVREK